MTIQFSIDNMDTTEVALFDVFEVLITTGEPILDPFRTVRVEGTFNGKTVAGFCDSQDGSVYRIRFMPTETGKYTYDINFQSGDETARFAGEFTAVERGRQGLLKTDGWHFVWSGTDEHFFWNGTTAYLMAGCSDEAIVRAIDRLANLGVNRIRVSLCPSRQVNAGRWYEVQVAPRVDFTFCYSPWLCARPENVLDPGFDVTRFDVAYWQKYERLLKAAHSRDMIVQVVFFTDAQETQNYPFDREKIGDDPDERRYYAYAVARLAAFSNVEWCVTNEWKLFRPDAWAETIGDYLHSLDAYGHLTSVHGHGVFPFRASKWSTHALFQVWDEHGGYRWMRKQRQEQSETGIIKPQINEEYGYEDHYPGPWGEGRVAPARNADSRRRLAWEITMAGGYQTTGESAANGLGGWVNGQGDDSMTMLTGYRHLRTFFEGFEWWQLEPVDTDGTMMLREPGVRTVTYFPDGTTGNLPAAESGFQTRWYNPRTGTFEAKPDTSGDWVCLQEKL